jgi:thiol:disulfide interchange protein
VIVVADLTTNDQRIWKELAEMDEYGLPVNLVYPARVGARPIKLPTLLSVGVVKEAVEKAAKAPAG